MSSSDLNKILAAGLSSALGQPVVIGAAKDDRKEKFALDSQVLTHELVSCIPQAGKVSRPSHVSSGPLAVVHNFSLVQARSSLLSNKTDSFPIQIECQSPGKSQTIDVHPNYTVEHLKWLIQSEWGIPTQSQKLTFQGQDLEDSKILSDYNLKKGTKVILEVKSSKPMQIFVKMVDGKSRVIEMTPSETIQQLKMKIRKLDGNSADDQMILFRGKSMQDDRTMSECNIQNESTVHVMLRLKGAGENVMNVPSDELDPKFNFKYPEKDDKDFMRGGKKLERPLGCQKYAIKVLGRYENDHWLGVKGAISRTYEVEGEWPVSYHGTKQNVADDITKNGYELSKGKRFKFGKGIYSTPTPSVAERYATVFEYEGKRYKLMFMNRINPDYTREVQEPSVGTYYVTSDETQIRPYAILIKEMKN